MPLSFGEPAKPIGTTEKKREEVRSVRAQSSASTLLYSAARLCALRDQSMVPLVTTC